MWRTLGLAAGLLSISLFGAWAVDTGMDNGSVLYAVVAMAIIFFGLAGVFVAGAACCELISRWVIKN